MVKTIVIIAGIVAIVIAGVFVISKQATQKPSSSQFTIGKKAPDFVLKDFDGKDFNLASFYGQKVVVLDFWAAWCPFCVEEMKILEATQQTYTDELVMIGIHRTDSGEPITTGKKFADEQGVTYLLVQGTEEIYDASTKGVRGMPVAVFIDKNGVVQDVKVGPKTEEEIKEKVEKLIK